MARPEYFVDVLLPVSVEDTYTYHCTAEEYERLEKGMRVAVIFGKRKIQTGVVYRKHRQAPPFPTKSILQIIDEEPILTPQAWELYEFMAYYYLTPLGTVLRMALPAAFLLEGEHYIRLHTGLTDEQREKLPAQVREILDKFPRDRSVEIKKILGVFRNKSKALKTIHRLTDMGYLQLEPKVSERYKPRLKAFLDLTDEAKADDLLKSLSPRAHKQKEAVMYFFQHYLPARRPVAKEILTEKFSAAVIKALKDKGIFREIKVPTDRQVFDTDVRELPRLTPLQERAKAEILHHFGQDKPVLLHGVTASGKTEIYLRIIDRYLQEGRQVLYMLPEIALTAQMVARIRERFGNRVAVYHSRYSLNERYEIWKNVLRNREEARLIVGTRSAVFLPYTNLGLVVTDEEHDASYKEHFHQPMYHGRDMALMLGRLHKANVLLGSATPSVESYHHARTGKYALVRLDKKYYEAERPAVEIVDLSRAYKEGKIKHSFSRDTLETLRRTVESGFQAMVFINRRGYAPVVTCRNCGHTEHCPHCSVALTYHRSDNHLHCHYCGYKMPYQNRCRACHGTDLEILGKGTQKIVSELKEIFPAFRIERMDADTTRSRNALERLIERFQAGEIDILVGTQMITKGLDFGSLQLAVVVSADSLIARPDFRSHERAFQLLTQITGRTGRRTRRGQVLIQAYEARHPVLKWTLEGDYEGFFENEIRERRMFGYPPFVKLVQLELQARNPEMLNRGAEWLAKVLKHYFPHVLGPSEPPVYKVKNYYRLEILVKLDPEKPDRTQRLTMAKIFRHYRSIAAFRQVKLRVNADP